MKLPTTEQLNTAIAWLNCYEGEGSDNCLVVAAYLEYMELQHTLRSVARKGGVPVAALRKKLVGAK